MKQLVFPREAPVEILNKSYVTNIQFSCQSVTEALELCSDYASKDWGLFSIIRGVNETVYEGYKLDSIVIDTEDVVVHFILSKGTELSNDGDEYAEAGRILLGESE